MRTSTAIASGHIALSPAPLAPRPQTGGRRPPRDPRPNRRSLVHRRAPRSLKKWLRGLGLAAVAAGALGSGAAAQQANPPLPDLSGTYRCEGDEATCDWSGWVFTVTQSGSELQIKNEKGEIGNAQLTSHVSLSAGPIWNMLGVIVSPDNRVIQWSNGTKWRKQV